MTDITRPELDALRDAAKGDDLLSNASLAYLRALRDLHAEGKLVFAPEREDVALVRAEMGELHVNCKPDCGCASRKAHAALARILGETEADPTPTPKETP